MNTKENFKSNKLVPILKEKTGWNLARVKFLAAIICALFKLQTVCYLKLAQDLIAKIVFSMLPAQPPYRLSMDRTNWKFGALNINIRH